MNQKSIVVLLAIIFFLPGHRLSAQDNLLKMSVSPKIGAYTDYNSDQDGLLAGLEFSMMNQRWVGSAHFYYGQEWLLLNAGPARYFNQASLLFGKNKYFSSFRFEYQAGIAALWGIRHTQYYSEGLFDGHYGTEKYAKPGLVSEVGIEFLASRHVGIGTQLNVNLNTEFPIVAFAVSLSFGKLK